MTPALRDRVWWAVLSLGALSAACSPQQTALTISVSAPPQVALVSLSVDVIIDPTPTHYDLPGDGGTVLGLPGVLVIKLPASAPTVRVNLDGVDRDGYSFVASSVVQSHAHEQVRIDMQLGTPPFDGGVHVTAGIAASATSIVARQSTVLTWHTENAVKADLNGSPVPLNGSLTVSPAATTTYRITGTGSDGTTDWGEVTISVR
jgi:hypothetical protein